MNECVSKYILQSCACVLYFRAFMVGPLGSSLVPQELLSVFMSVLDLSLASPLRPICFIVFQSCDLWSLGVIIYVMLCGYPPFYSKHHSRTIPKDMRKKIMTGSFDFPEDEWSQISEMAKDIVRKWDSFRFTVASGPCVG